jgi:hypothetical protein
MESTKDEIFYDVIYFEDNLEDCNRIRALLQKTFTNAEVKNEHDDIKGYRVSFEDKEDVKEEFWKLLLLAGYTTLSIEVIARTDKHPDQALLGKILDEVIYEKWDSKKN